MPAVRNRRIGPSKKLKFQRHSKQGVDLTENTSSLEIWRSRFGRFLLMTFFRPAQAGQNGRSRHCGTNSNAQQSPLHAKASSECQRRRSPMLSHRLSRRHVLATTVAAGAGLAIVSQASERAQAQPARRTIVDAQVHIWKMHTPERPWPA